MDKHHPHLVFAANWFCPPCLDCRRSYETREWSERVHFVQGLADADDTYQEILQNMASKFGYDFEKEELIVRKNNELAAEGNSTQIVETLGSYRPKTVMVNLDANHEYEGLLKELIFYAPLVSLNSYLVVQDAKLDKIWGVPAVSAAIEKFLSLVPVGEFVLEPELKFHGYSQHVYLRRARKSIGMDYFPRLMHEMMEVAKEK